MSKNFLLVWLTAERTADPDTGRDSATPNTFGIPMILAVELRGFEPRTPCLQSRCSSQLRYSPGVFPNARAPVGLGGVEPPTSRLSGVRSNHLSYKPFSELLLPLVAEVGDLTLSIPNTFGTPT